MNYSHLEIFGNTLHLLQSERGYSTLFLQENNDTTKKLLKECYLKADKNIFILSKELDKHSENNTTTTTKYIEQIKSSFEELNNTRSIICSQIDNQKISFVIDFYSKQLINPIIRTMTSIALSIKDAHPSAINAYCFFLQWKERAGIERYSIICGIADSSFENNYCFDNIKLIISEQDYYKESFLSIATIEQQELVESIYNSPKMRFLHDLHMQLKSGILPAELLNISIDEWFEVISEKVDLLYKIEQRLYLSLNKEHILSNKKNDTELSTGEKITYNLEIFKSIDENIVNEIINSGKIYQVPKNKIIVLENTANSHLHIILVGFVKIFKTNENNKETILQILSNGDNIMPECVFTGINFNANAKTVSDVLMFSVPVQNINKHIFKDSKLAKSMLGSIANNSAKFNQELITLKTQTVDKRIGIFLLKLLHDKKIKTKTITLPCSKSLIASYLGMNREVLSRGISKLTEQGFIVNGSQITLPDRYSLCKYCNGKKDNCIKHQDQTENK